MDSSEQKNLDENLFNLVILNHQHDEIAYLVEQGANINQCNPFRKTLLMMAAENNNPVLARLLINLGADIHLEDHNGNTALHLAFKCSVIVKMLVEQGLNINHKNIYGETILLKTASRVINKVDVDLFDFLLKNGADIHVTDTDHYTVLTGFLGVNSTNNASAFDLVKLMIERGVDVFVANNENETALMIAKEKGLTKIVQFIESHQEQKGLEALIKTPEFDHGLIAM